MCKILKGDCIFYDSEDNRLFYCEHLEELENPRVIPIVTELTKRDIEVIKKVINKVEGE